jgi:hypothetical protein
MFLLYNSSRIRSSEWIELLQIIKETYQMKLRAIIALSSAALLTMVFALVSGAGPDPCPADADLDGICDINDDNCLGVANPNQSDPDTDGYGTACDLDINNDCIVGAGDAYVVFINALQTSPWSPLYFEAMDVDGNGTVGSGDAYKVFSNSLQAPGPSARVCAECSSALPGLCPNLP